MSTFNKLLLSFLLISIPAYKTIDTIEQFAKCIIFGECEHQEDL